MLLLVHALAAPSVDLCTQPALDVYAAAENARWANLEMLDISRTAHTLSEATTVTFESTTVSLGERVQATGRPGTLKPEATGQPLEVAVGEHQGTVVCFTRSVSGSFHNELAVVRWDAASWVPRNGGEPVALPQFQGLIHPSYLKPASAAAP